MTIRTRFLLALGALLLASIPSTARAAPPTTPGPAGIPPLAQTFLRESHTVGLSLGIYQDGNVYTYHYGETEKGNNRRPTDDTLYAIASVTKTFTGTLLARAVAEKRVRMDDDIRLYLDGKYPNLEFQGEPIRLFHLINHNSGLPFFLYDRPASPTEETERAHGYTRADFYRDLHHVTLTTTPGTRFQYSNAAAQLLGYILERVYGMSFEKLVAQKIVQPLAMKHTKITLSSTEQKHFRGYDENGNVAPEVPDSLQAAGAIKSTVTDLLKYMTWHLAEKDPVAKETHAPRWSSGPIFSVGLNWQMFRLPTYRVIWQEGSLPGHSSYCVCYPEFHLAIVALTNEFDRDSSAKLTKLVKEITRTVEPRAVDLP